jgi:hypothetical protein
MRFPQREGEDEDSGEDVSTDEEESDDETSPLRKENPPCMF